MRVEQKYWNNRYVSGGTSGTQSEGESAKWKWNIILKYNPDLSRIIDYGCGDLRFIEDKKFTNYTGIDSSEIILERNRRLKPSYIFVNSNNPSVETMTPAPTVLCIDMLFHISEENEYLRILHRLNSLTSDLLFVHTWEKNPLDKWYGRILLERAKEKLSPRLAFKGIARILNPGTRYEKDCLFYRPFKSYLPHMPNLDLIEVAMNANRAGAMYVFKRRG